MRRPAVLVLLALQLAATAQVPVPFRQGDRLGFRTLQGDTLVPATAPWNEGGKMKHVGDGYVQYVTDGGWAVVHAQHGQVVPSSPNIQHLGGGLFSVSKGNAGRLLGPDGSEVLGRPIRTAVSGARPGQVIVVLPDASYRLWDERADWLADTYDHIEVFPELPGLYRACRDGRCGVVDTLGRELVPMLYKQVRTVPDKRFRLPYLEVEQDGLWGVVRSDGQVLYPPFARQFIWCTPTFFLATTAEGKGVYDIHGRVLVPPGHRAGWSGWGPATFHLYGQSTPDAPVQYFDTLGGGLPDDTPARMKAAHDREQDRSMRTFEVEVDDGVRQGIVEGGDTLLPGRYFPAVPIDRRPGGHDNLRRHFIEAHDEAGIHLFSPDGTPFPAPGYRKAWLYNLPGDSALILGITLEGTTELRGLDGRLWGTIPCGELVQLIGMPGRPQKLVQCGGRDQFGVWDLSGRELVPPRFSEVKSYWNDELFLVRTTDDWWVQGADGTVYR